MIVPLTVPSPGEYLDFLAASLKISFKLELPVPLLFTLAVITFHSLEDRIVKRAMADWCKGCICPDDFPVCVCGHKPQGELVMRKPAEASQEEKEENPRSRSARLRAIRKL